MPPKGSAIRDRYIYRMGDTGSTLSHDSLAVAAVRPEGPTESSRGRKPPESESPNATPAPEGRKNSPGSFVPLGLRGN